jgi:hypothetical protein
LMLQIKKILPQMRVFHQSCIEYKAQWQFICK